MTGPSDDEADREQTDREPADHGEESTSPAEPELDSSEVDERFAAMIAELDDAPQWPSSTDDEEEDEDDRPTPTATATDTDEPTLLELWDTELPPDEDDPEDTYTPPPPPPVPRPSAPAVLGVLLVVGGLTLVVSPDLLDVGTELGMLTGIVAFLGGAAMLVWRLRPEPDEDDDPDDGAIV